MKFGALYTSLTKNPEVKEDAQEQTVEEIQKSEASMQLRHTWKESTVTQEFVEEVTQEIASLLDSSVKLACTYPTHNNHQQIVQNLIRVDALKKLLDKYVYA